MHRLVFIFYACKCLVFTALAVWRQWTCLCLERGIWMGRQWWAKVQIPLHHVVKPTVSIQMTEAGRNQCPGDASLRIATHPWTFIRATGMLKSHRQQWDPRMGTAPCAPTDRDWLTYCSWEGPSCQQFNRMLTPWDTFHSEIELLPGGKW